MEVEEEKGHGAGQGCPKSQEYSPCCMSFHRTQYLELSSKVTRQLCFELLTWGTEREEQCEKVAGEKPCSKVFCRGLGIEAPPPCVPESRGGPEGRAGGSSWGECMPSPWSCTVRDGGTTWWES